MTPVLFDPLDPPEAAWPDTAPIERLYIEGVARAGVPAMVANVRTRWLALRAGDHVFPVTVNDSETGDSYVCLPHSAYALYGRQELDIVDVGLLRPILKSLIYLADRLLLAVGINRIVHVDNWLLSTNLHGGWDGRDIAEIRALLTTRFPGHVLAIRSIDDWSCPSLLAAVRRDGWVCVPSRQIWVVDDMARDWRKRQSVANDRRRMAKSGLIVDPMDHLRDGDAARIAELYRMLYVGKYSALNPIFTPGWIAMTHAAGVIAYRGARDADGQLLAIAGSLVRDRILTPPIVGYDTSRPQSDGLYRIACYLFSEMAEAAGLRLNGSAGAADFKRRRGAHGVIEYWAMYVGHLPPTRRTTVHMLAWLLEHLAVPMMRRRGL